MTFTYHNPSFFFFFVPKYACVRFSFLNNDSHSISIDVFSIEGVKIFANNAVGDLPRNITET